jgi:hypothetical protein
MTAFFNEYHLERMKEESSFLSVFLTHSDLAGSSSDCSCSPSYKEQAHLTSVTSLFACVSLIASSCHLTYMQFKQSILLSLSSSIHLKEVSINISARFFMYHLNCSVLMNNCEISLSPEAYRLQE